MAFVTTSRPAVVWPPVPLWSVRGATTVTLVPASFRRAWTVVSIPGVPTPSSFVTITRRMTGFLVAAVAEGAPPARSPTATEPTVNANVPAIAEAPADTNDRRCRPVRSN